MGIFSHERIYSTKFLNAEITDQAGRIHVVHIKNILGNYFVTKIDKMTYVFRIKGRIYTYHAFGMRTVRKIYYNTDNYMPISPPDYKKLEQTINDNGLPKIDRPLFNILRFLGKRERKDFKEHDFDEIFNEIANDKEASKYEKEREAMKQFLDHLNITKIVTPLKEVTEFWEGEMIAPDPQFFGDVLPSYQRLDNEDKKITNTPVRGKIPWLKMLLIMLAIAAVAVVAVWAFQSGSIQLPNFSGGGGFLPSQFGTNSANDLMRKYPNPEDLKIACDQHQLDCTTLPPEVKKMLDAYKPPTVTPKQQTIEIGP